MDQKDFSNNNNNNNNTKYGHNGSVLDCGGEVLSVQVVSSNLAINGGENNNNRFVYGNGKEDKREEEQQKRTVAVRYRECLKNHAASIGSHAVDGCGEFMPRGAEGTEDAMKCMACGCHRNFHRREADGEVAAPYAPYGRNVVAAPPYGNFVFSVGQQQEEEGGGDGQRRVAKKRFRTKFTAEQKEKMFVLAERIGWRIQKQDEAAVQRFCDEVGVRRHVLKVWMHNNKNNFAKKS